MKSFPLELRPRPAPRLAALAVLLHLAAATAPWLARLPAVLALLLSLAAMAACGWTLAWIPGPQSPLQALRCNGGRWSAQLRDGRAWIPVTVAGMTRVSASLVLAAFQGPGGRFGWLLGRQELPGTDFRRLKARLRLSC